MEAALSQIDALSQRLKKFETNFKKCSAVNRTKGYLEGRLIGLNEIWGNICKVNDKILSLVTSENENESYIEDDEFGDLEEQYFSVMGQIKDQLEALKPRQEGNSGQAGNSNGSGNQQPNGPMPGNQSKVKLPKISLPSFSGSYHTWMSFKNRFSNLIHDSTALSNVEKLEYLKSCVTGEAERTIQRFQITDQNYKLAWDRLNEKYDNKRILQDTQVEAIIDRRPIRFESAKELRELLDVIQESLEALNNLEVQTGQWDPMLMVLVRRKLPFKTREEWEKELNPTDVPTYDQLIAFLEKRYRTVESLELVGESSMSKGSHFKHQTSNDKSAQQGSQRSCIACNNERHSLLICQTFLNMSQSSRSAFVNAKKLCRNCLAVNHTVAECKSSKTCFRCCKNHHTLLHRDERQAQSKEPSYGNQSGRNSTSYFNERGQNQARVNGGTASNQGPPVSSESTSHNLANNAPNQRRSYTTTTSEKVSSRSEESIESNESQPETLFPTAIISVRSEGGIVYKLRELLDQCSDGEAFIKESTANMLRWRQTEVPSFEVAGMDEVITARINKATRFELIIDKRESMNIEANIVKNLVGILPKAERMWHKGIFPNLKLADPNFATPNNVDIMLGGKVYAEILLNGMLKEGGYLAQNTKLGWIISGKGHQQGPQNRVKCLHTRIVTSPKKIIETDEILKKFWEMEEMPRVQKKPTQEEEECERIFKKSYRRLDDGRVQVKLPFKERPEEVLGESRSQAVARWLAMERKLEKNQELKHDYMAAIQEHLELNHMKIAKTSEKEHQVKNNEKTTFSCYYIPHHAVVREESKTTKTRIVFDASAKTSTKKSLNEILMVGPTIQESLVVRLMKWRCYKYGLKGDITKMYRQIKVYDEDVNYQRMVFRFSKNEPIQDFHLNTLTFGTACAPYMAIRSLKQVAIDNEKKFPEAAKVIQNDFHVDDLLTGADSIEKVKELWNQITEILKSAKFTMRKWSSNDNNVLEQIPEEEREFKVPEMKLEDSLKTLGIGWLPIADQFFFTVPEFEREEKLTKRIFLSQAARLFDPLGWLGPAVMKPKVMFQKVWKEGSGWDEEMSEGLAEEWKIFRGKLNVLEKIRIPRWFGFVGKKYQRELHGFSDASERAFGAVIYLKSTNEIGNSRVELVFARSRVAPVKTVKLPRLELCGGVLLANMIDMVKAELGIATAYCWTDSSITLDWINSSADKHKTFVANRISEIQEFTRPADWRHVEGKQNPADCLSRGIDPDELKDHNLWWNGPTWLKLPKSEWPRNLKVKVPGDQLELKGVKAMVTMKKLNSVLLYMLEKYSSFNLLARVTARIKTLSSARPKSRFLFCKEIVREKLFWIKLVQESFFGSEIKSIREGKSLHGKSKLMPLYPFVDSDGILRVGGRLTEAAIEYDAKHQVIIPKESRIAKMIINDAHEVTKHGGVQLTMTYTRNKYWIVDCKKTTRNQIHKCVTCHRYSEKLQEQLMGSLPQARVDMSRAFLHAGVDYAGPLQILQVKKPGRRQVTKGYVAVFVCLCTKAIHLEVVSQLTSEAFLAAFTRFTGRRGLPSNMYSDNSTTFIGAKNELDEDMKIIKGTLEPELADIVLKDEVQWSFIPPHAPHWGGIWEAGVKSMKHHVKRVTGNSIHTFEEITTMLVEIEAVLNSRPLCPVSNDPNDLSVLTPGHFLIGESLLSPPRPSLLNANESRLGVYKQISQRIEHFARRWKAEYLATLQCRRKWMRQCENVEIGDLVLIKDDDLPPKKWLMGRVIEVFPDSEGLVRKVVLKTERATLMRPIHKISILPIDKPMASGAL